MRSSTPSVALGHTTDAIEDEAGELLDDLVDGETTFLAVPPMHPIAHPQDGIRHDLHIEIWRELPGLHPLAQNVLPELFIALDAFQRPRAHGVHLQEVAEVDKEIRIVRIKGADMRRNSLGQLLGRGGIGGDDLLETRMQVPDRLIHDEP